MLLYINQNYLSDGVEADGISLFLSVCSPWNLKHLLTNLLKNLIYVWMVNEEVGEGDVINGCRYQSIGKYIHGIAVGWPQYLTKCQ